MEKDPFESQLEPFRRTFRKEQAEERAIKAAQKIGQAGVKNLIGELNTLLSQRCDEELRFREYLKWNLENGSGSIFFKEITVQYWPSRDRSGITTAELCIALTGNGSEEMGFYFCHPYWNRGLVPVESFCPWLLDRVIKCMNALLKELSEATPEEFYAYFFSRWPPF